MSEAHPLAAWRKANDLTQDELGRRVGVLGSHISQIESRKRTASLGVAVKLERETGGIVKATDLAPLEAAE